MSKFFAVSLSIVLFGIMAAAAQADCGAACAVGCAPACSPAAPESTAQAPQAAARAPQATRSFSYQAYLTTPYRPMPQRSRAFSAPRGAASKLLGNY